MTTGVCFNFRLGSYTPTIFSRSKAMAALRQRRGVLAVDHVDRLEEPKEHVHIHRVVRALCPCCASSGATGPELVSSPVVALAF